MTSYEYALQSGIVQNREEFDKLAAAAQKMSIAMGRNTLDDLLEALRPRPDLTFLSMRGLVDVDPSLIGHYERIYGVVDRDNTEANDRRRRAARGTAIAITGWRESRNRGRVAAIREGT